MVLRLVTIVLCGAFVTLGCATKSYVNEQVWPGGNQAGPAGRDHPGQSWQSRRHSGDEAGVNLRPYRRESPGGRRRRPAHQGPGYPRDRGRCRRDRRSGSGGAGNGGDSRRRSRLAQRLAGRNSYRVLDTKAIYFDSGRIDIRAADLATLDEVAEALAADPNAILELRGFADTHGSDRYNRELTRERIEAVMRYLMVRRDIELRQMQGIPIGQDPVPAAGRPRRVLAQARRVDLRVLTPWSSSEDRTASRPEPGRVAIALHGGIVGHRGAVGAAQRGPAERGAGEQRCAGEHVDSSAGARLPALLRTLTPRDLGGD